MSSPRRHALLSIGPWITRGGRENQGFRTSSRGGGTRTARALSVRDSALCTFPVLTSVCAGSKAAILILSPRKPGGLSGVLTYLISEIRETLALGWT